MGCPRLGLLEDLESPHLVLPVYLVHLVSLDSLDLVSMVCSLGHLEQLVYLAWLDRLDHSDTSLLEYLGISDRQILAPSFQVVYKLPCQLPLADLELPL